MSTDQKYFIKYMSMGCDPKNLYWFKEGEEWIADPNQATLFNKPEGITEVGRLLVEQEWVTHLIPENVVPRVTKSVSPPSSEFYIVVDCDGDPQEVFSGNTNIDEVFYAISRLDKDSGYHPHSAWKRDNGGFSRVFERIGKDPK